MNPQTPSAPAPPLKAAAPAPSVAPPQKDKAAEKESDWKYALKDGAKFSIDHLLVQGSLEATLQLQERMTATYRTLSVEEIQKVESVLPLGEMRDKSMQFLTNEMTITQLYFSLIAMNGKALPAVPSPEELEKMPGKKDPRREILRNMPGVMFDILTAGFNEFDQRAKALVKGDAVANF